MLIYKGLYEAKKHKQRLLTNKNAWRRTVAECIRLDAEWIGRESVNAQCVYIKL